MSDLLYILLASCGLTWIVINGWIFAPIRPERHEPGGRFVRCAACIGFWAGVITSLTLATLSSVITIDINLIDAFFLGCASSVVSYWGDRLVSDDGLEVSTRSDG